jgi:hypothetical protein
MALARARKWGVGALPTERRALEARQECRQVLFLLFGEADLEALMLLCRSRANSGYIDWG